MFQKVILYFPFINGIGGHTIRRFENYEKSFNNNKRCICITFLRDPISRYLSHYNYQKISMGINLDIERFINDSKFNNFQTKKISGEEDNEKAKNILKNKFNFVGISEEFDLSLILLRKLFPVIVKIISYRKQNVLTDKNIRVERFDDFNNEIKKKIIKNNKFDIELYNFAKENLFYSRISDNFPDLIKDELFELNKGSNNSTSAIGFLNKGAKFVFEKVIVAILY